MSFGVWHMLIGISITTRLYTDELMIGFFLPLSTVTVYALAASLARYIGFEFGIVARAREVFWPAVVALHAKGDIDGLRRLYFQASRFLILTVTVAVVIAGVWAEAFYRQWIGGDGLSDESIADLTLVFHILLGAVWLQFLSGTAGFIVMAAGRIKIVAILSITGTILNLALNIILIQFLGMVGVALGTLGAGLLGAFAYPWLAGRQLSEKLPKYIITTCTRPAAVGLVLGIAYVAGRVPRS